MRDQQQEEISRMNPIDEIPVIDFQPFLTGNTLYKKSVASAIDTALNSIGFIYISNHGIDQSKVDECFNWVSYISLVTLKQESVLRSYM